MEKLKYTLAIKVDLWRSSGRTRREISDDRYLLSSLARILRKIDKTNFRFGSDEEIVTHALLNNLSYYEKQNDEERTRIISHDGHHCLEIWTTDYFRAKEIMHKIDSFLGTKNYSSMRELLG